jgi:hypothetical protein
VSLGPKFTGEAPIPAAAITGTAALGTRHGPAAGAPVIDGITGTSSGAATARQAANLDVHLPLDGRSGLMPSSAHSTAPADKREVTRRG